MLETAQATASINTLKSLTEFIDLCVPKQLQEATFKVFFQFFIFKIKQDEFQKIGYVGLLYVLANASSAKPLLAIPLMERLESFLAVLDSTGTKKKLSQ